MDFKTLNESLKTYYPLIVSDLVPGGKKIGKEYTCGSMRGGKGKSFKFNLETGLWSDFATNDSGIDIISLKAAVDNTTQFQAAVALQEKYQPSAEVKTSIVPQEPPIVSPPKNAPNPRFKRFNMDPSFIWKYLDTDGDLMFYICRYETESGKTFIPFTWRADGKWVNKGWPAPRPLYRLHEAKNHSNIMIVQGEKACDAAQQIVGGAYCCLTWPNGDKSWKNADWKPIYNKNVIIWPDGDESGIESAKELFTELKKHCKTTKLIQTDRNHSWDAADALAEGWDWKRLLAWAKPLAISADKTLVLPINLTEASENRPHVVELMTSNDPIIDLDVHTATQEALWIKLGVKRSTHGQPTPNMDNCSRVLEGIPDFIDAIWYDEFHRKIMTNLPFINKSNQISEWTDAEDLKMLKFFQRVMGFQRVSLSQVVMAVVEFAKNNIRNEPKDWFESLEWDGVKRLDTFMTDYIGSQDNEYTRSVSNNFWISMVARIYRPGCQVDNMVVFEGGQGTFKSTAMRIIGGEWHSEAQESITTNNFLQALQGKMIIEIAELSSFPRTEILRIKQTISCPKDRFRAPYDRKPADQPRMNIFVATTNEDKYLHDTTGGRRFWPIRCGKIDTVKLEQDRSQLFAEAVLKFKQGVKWFLTPLEATKTEQEARRLSDSWELIIKNYLLTKRSILLHDLAQQALGIDRSKLDMPTQRRIASVLRLAGWTISKGAWVCPEPQAPSDEFDF